MPRLSLYPLFLAYLQDSLNKRKLAASSRSADRNYCGIIFNIHNFIQESFEYANQRHMESFVLIDGQALYRLRPTTAKLTVFTAIMIAPNYLARALLA